MRLILTGIRLSTLALALVAGFACSEDKKKDEGDADVQQTGEDGGEDAGEEDPFAKHEGTLEGITDQKLVPRVSLESPTGGSGGETGAVEGTYESKEGISGKYYLRVPEDAGSKAYKVYAHFHGDGGASLSKAQVDKVSEALGVIGLSMEAPDKSSWWSGMGLTKGRHFEKFLTEFVHKKYNVDTSELIVSGVSGGSNFLGGIFLPEFSYKHATTAFLLCGGARNLLQQYKWTDDVQIKTYLYFYRTAGDFLEEQIVDAIKYYQAADIRTKEATDESSSGHCGFDAGAKVIELYKSLDAPSP